MLTKSFQRTFHPGTPGRPAVPYQPATTVCTPRTAGGYWKQTCKWVTVPVGSIARVPIGTPYRLHRFGVDLYLCTSTWVRTNTSTAPVCTTTPEVLAQPAVPAIPSRVDLGVSQQWGDAGANSVVSQEGNCVCTFTMEKVGGAAVGFTTDLDDQGNLSRLSHAFYFRSVGRACLFSVMEHGVGRTYEGEYDPGDEFKIQRAGEKVTFWHNGERVYASDLPSEGEINVGCALYASGDFIA